MKTAIILIALLLSFPVSAYDYYPSESTTIKSTDDAHMRDMRRSWVRTDAEINNIRRDSYNRSNGNTPIQNLYRQQRLDNMLFDHEMNHRRY